MFMLMSTSAFVTEQENGAYDWPFLSRQAWPRGYNQTIAKPDNLVCSFNDYLADFCARISHALPEKSINEVFMTDNSSSTISLAEECEVFINFIHEDAGYKNAFVFFTFDSDNQPQSPADVSETIVFPNLSYPHLSNGHRLSLGVFTAGTHIGFVIAANACWYDTEGKPSKLPYDYSLQDLNPKSNHDLRQHVVLLYGEEVSEVILGFEELPRTWGDNDFNDAVFSVKITTETALVTGAFIFIPEVNDRNINNSPLSDLILAISVIDSEIVEHDDPRLQKKPDKHD
jgi:hypothetical protein